jgi:tetratricopeptide (TPR) repeat protein
MARLILLVALFCLAGSAQDTDKQIKVAGVCARCHVISVVEWGMSRHWTTGTGCTACHGESQGHIIDERNNIKPERIPHGAAIAGLCLSCHSDGCPKTKNTANCQNCHHIHALVNPNTQAVAKDPRDELLAARWKRYEAHMSRAKALADAGNWKSARDSYRSALEQKPGDSAARAGLRLCSRRLQPGLPGFEISGAAIDAETGLPAEARVAGLGVEMLLVRGGEFDMGSEDRQDAKPVHTVRIAPLYLGKYELTQEQWTKVMGANPSARQGGRMPVEQVSWEDCRQFIARLNARVRGGGFRLPTEAEWEYAAGAEAVETDSALRAPRAVGSGQPNKFGFFDMRGNVWEWCSTLFRPYPYDAADGRESAEDAGLRVLRGAGYSDTSWFDSTSRHSERPQRRLDRKSVV